MRSFFSVVGLGLFALPSILAAPLPGVGDVADIVADVVAHVSVDVPSKYHSLSPRQNVVDGLVNKVLGLLDEVLGGSEAIGRRDLSKDVSDVLDLANESYSAAPGSDEKIQNAIDRIAALQPAPSAPSAAQLRLVNIKLAAIVRALLFSKDAHHPASVSGPTPDYSKLADDVVILFTNVYIRLGALPGSVDYQRAVDDLKSDSQEFLPLIVLLDLKAFIDLWEL